MPRGKTELAEQIIPKLREVEVEVGRGKTVAETVKKVGVTEQTDYRLEQAAGSRQQPSHPPTHPTSAPMPTQFSIGVDPHRHTCGPGTFSSISPLEISSYRYRGTLQLTCPHESRRI